jgi:hypothetical protein
MQLRSVIRKWHFAYNKAAQYFCCCTSRPIAGPDFRYWHFSEVPIRVSHGRLRFLSGLRYAAPRRTGIVGAGSLSSERGTFRCDPCYGDSTPCSAKNFL